MENIVKKKREIAHFEQFHLFPPCSPEAVFFNELKWVYMEEGYNQGKQSYKFFLVLKVKKKKIL